ncbi:DUF6882 domain-containing protein [Actinomadura kijaniata]|uniref:DUF6882 domain-containing protein n=1 Tax=Actinomadura kijaniata TaxID=46161 RepID=UPI00082E1889|nr:DUF6882 domain-containing protein [Actinomadura kijaniata]
MPFSEELRALTTGGMPETVLRFRRLNAALAGRALRRDPEAGAFWVDGDRRTASVLGTLAEDHTFQWTWAARDPGDPVCLHAGRLRALGERHGVPELTAPLVDLGAFADPRAAADVLAARVSGLLGSGLVIKYPHGGRALTYYFVEMPEAPPPPDEDPADERLDIIELGVPAPLPGALMEIAAPAVARTLDTGHALAAEVGGWRTVPVWEPAAGVLDFGNGRTVTAVEVGLVRPDGVWEWTGRPGAERFRAAAREHGAAELAADRVDLSGHPRGAHVVEVLSRAAAHLGGASGHWAVPGDGGVRHFALTGDGLAEIGLSTLDRALDRAADIVQQLTAYPDRRPVMREMVRGALALHGFGVWQDGPDMLFGSVDELGGAGMGIGTHRYNVTFSRDATIIRTEFGPMTDFL